MNQAKKRGVIVFATLLVASLMVTTIWPYDGRVAPAPRREPYSAIVFRENAERGDTGAMYLLGTLHLGGAAIPKDLVEAHKWFNLAASRASAENYRPYQGKRAEAAAEMTPRQIATAQRRAREWLQAFERRTP